MKIIVLVKDVPDTYVDRNLSLETGLVDRESSENILDEICERAVEVALKASESLDDVEVVALTMGRADTVETLRKALAMGADSGVHIDDEQLHGADLTLTAEVIAQAISKTGFDLVITGNNSTDGSGGALPAMLAERLGVPLASGLSSVEITADKVSGSRPDAEGVATISAPLPSVVSITEANPDGRFPNFKGIMAAKRKPVETYSLEDLGVEADPSQAPRSIMVSVAQRPPREAGTKIVDEGDAGKQLAEFLISNRLV
ncbi:MAG TPA: electron transfer flavoprotein subunit beta/FixA family protein [Beutenbergiaceae bacterium]|nr:electron transfer flavoprotein subunit beta/FixA family protein [Beutenbergiaceae bacterium]